MSRLRIDTMALQGICGAAARASGETRLAASPKTSMACTKAKSSIRLWSSSSRLRPATNCAIASAASIMWRMRARSSSRILNLRGPQYLVAEMPAEVLRGAQVDLVRAKHGAELGFHRGQPEQAWLTARLELH